MTENEKLRFSRQIWLGTILSFQKGIITSYLSGDYFQALRNIIAPAALMVRQQSSLIITPEWEYSS